MNAEEMLGKSSRFLYPGDEEYLNVGKVKYKQIDNEGEGKIETRFVKKNGEIIDVVLSSVPVDLSNLSAGVIFTVHDISDKKRAERDLQLISDFEQIIRGISTRFINLPIEDLEKTLLSAIKEICEFTGMDRGAIYLLSEDNSVLNHLCLYVREDDPLNGYDLPPIATEKMQWWLEQLKNNEIVSISILGGVYLLLKPIRENFLTPPVLNPC